MAEKTVEELRKELEEICEKTNTRLSGMLYLKDYYIKDNGWTEKAAYEYCIHLFQNGTIQQIKLIGKDGKEI